MIRTTLIAVVSSLSLAYLLASGVALAKYRNPNAPRGSLEWARAHAAHCPHVDKLGGTSWAERRADGAWDVVCGDDAGREWLRVPAR